MAESQLLMPKMGESIMEATILKWLKKEGETVEQDEAVLEIATDKVDSEVPSPFAGVLTKILFEEGAVVPVGQALATILAGGEAAASPQAAAPVPQVQAAAQAPQAQVAQPAPQPVASASAGPRFYSPLVLSIAGQEGISMTELEAMPGTGSEGRVTKRDILDFVEQRKNGVSQPAPQAQPTPQPQAQPPAAVVNEPAPAAPAQVAVQAAPAPVTSSAPSISVSGNMEIVEMDRMRKLIADHMVRSVQTSPHVTSFVEADVTNLVMWRDRHKNAFEKREGEKLTFTPVFIEALAKTIKDFPMINVSVDGDRILVKKDINIGMAAALPSGNLIVPVIRNADQLNLTGLAKQVNGLANRARANQLKPDEIQGGTYTLTNVGGFGNVMGTPIINQPQVAIMAVGAIRKKPAVIETSEGDFIGIRHMMFLSHSYDHRVVDGALGGMFVRRFADYLEQWDVNRVL